MKTLAAVIVATAIGATAHAGSLVVQSCPNATGQLTVGATAADVIDINGNSCVIVSAIPFAMSGSTSNAELVFILPTVPGAYFYMTDFSLTGNGGVPVTGRSFINYFNMSGGTVITGNPEDPDAEVMPGDTELKTISLDAIIPPSVSQQVNFHRAYSEPWRSYKRGLGVKIVVDKIGDGNTAVVARIVGFFR